jgi:pseudouridine-5'-phosphate glycosidase
MGVEIAIAAMAEFGVGYATAETVASISGRADNATQAAEIIRNHWSIGLESGILICVPCPEEVALPRHVVEAHLEHAMAAADAEGISGKDLTPFLLSRLSKLSNGATLRANLALLRQNARVAAQIAWAMTQPQTSQ